MGAEGRCAKCGGRSAGQRVVLGEAVKCRAKCGAGVRNVWG